MKNVLASLSIIACSLLTTQWLKAVENETAVYDKLPVKEVTIFKDGHAYILHEGKMKTDDRGNVLLDWLPAPIMGAFWSYSLDPQASLASVVSSREDLDYESDSVSLEDLLRGNVNKNVLVRQAGQPEPYQAMIVKILDPQAEPTSQAPVTAYAGYQPLPPSTETIVLLKAVEGIKAVRVHQIEGISFLDEPSDKVTRKKPKDTLKLNLNWKGEIPGTEALIGMAYVQRGIRWIPSYRVEIDGKGSAVLKLQATLINELADLDDVKAHLVIGVPNFAFKDVCDPISFQETVARLSSHFRNDNSTAYAFSNAAMSQVIAYNGEQRSMPSPGRSQMDLGPELDGAQKAEDLFVFTINHITLKKGQRMLLPIAEFTLAYEDVFTVDIAFAPPLEMRRNFDNQQQIELAKLFHKPNAIHKIRLENTSDYPLTTAPATILRDGRILAQGMITYTAVGNKGDLQLTTAVNIGVKKSDEQTNMIPSAVNWNGSSFSKIEMKGTIQLTNFSDKPVTLQVKRSILGVMVQADSEGTISQTGSAYDGPFFEEGLPYWWNWCSWPWWWYHFNSVGRADWSLELGAGQTQTVSYTWHYFWG